MGILHKHVKCIIGNGVELSIDALSEELEVLRNNEINISNRLFISCNRLILLYIALDQAREIKKGKVRLGQLEEALVPHMRIRFQEEV